MSKSLSFYGKLVSLVFLVIAMVMIKDYNIFLLICGMVFIFSYINRDKKYFLISLVLFLVTYILSYNDITFIVLRVLLVLVYALIIESSLLSLEKRFLYDKLFYRNRTSRKLKGYIKKYYYKDLLNANKENNKRIEKYVGKSDQYKKFLNIQAINKTNVEINNLYLLDRIRYDRFYSHKKSSLPFNWNNYDNFFIAISLLLFILVIVFGR